MLHFQCRGEWFKVNADGFMTQDHNQDFSGKWLFLGVSFHHWRNGIDVRFSSKTLPENLTGGIVWDSDHGTTRTWGGQYLGKLPRITQAYVD